MWEVSIDRDDGGDQPTYHPKPMGGDGYDTFPVVVVVVVVATTVVTVLGKKEKPSRSEPRYTAGHPLYPIYSCSDRNKMVLQLATRTTLELVG